jgi:hypothetical protein
MKSSQDREQKRSFEQAEAREPDTDEETVSCNDDGPVRYIKASPWALEFHRRFGGQ